MRRGQWTEVAAIDPNTTLLDYLRATPPQGLGCPGTKEGCAQGDCGACAVLIGELAPTTNQLRLRSVNACIKPLSSIDGCAVWTVEDLSDAQGRLHPVQHEMIKSHASQCGFCTPGFVMSLVALFETRLLQENQSARPITRDSVITAISGNLCRCTGYSPIIAAGLALESYRPAQQSKTGPTGLADTVEQNAHRGLMADDGSDQLIKFLKARRPPRPFRPRTLTALLGLRSRHPQAQVFAGATDVGLWINKQHRRFENTIDLGAVDSLQKVFRTSGLLTIGATARLTEAFAALCQDWPQLHTFTSRFAGLTVRNSATLGGNIANGSPIGDSMPLLIAMGARLRLQSFRQTRELPIEDFFLGFRRTALESDELVTAILIPRSRSAGNGQPGGRNKLRAYKISKRFEDDISAVCLAIAVEVDSEGIIRAARIGAGGVAATPARARATERSLLGQRWSHASIEQAGLELGKEFNPITDLRASAAYRKSILPALLHRFWIEENGQTLGLEEISLETIGLEAKAQKAMNR